MSTCKLLDLPQSISNFGPNSRVQIEKEYVAGLSGSGELIAHSLIQKVDIFKENSVQNFCWITVNSLNSPILVFFADEKLKFVVFTDSIHDSVPFDSQNCAASFSMQKINQYSSYICQFGLNSGLKCFIPSETNSLVLLDNQNKIIRYIIYPDGVYLSNLHRHLAAAGLLPGGRLVTNPLHYWERLVLLCSILEFPNAPIAKNG